MVLLGYLMPESDVEDDELGVWQTDTDTERRRIKQYQLHTAQLERDNIGT